MAFNPLSRLGGGGIDPALSRTAGGRGLGPIDAEIDAKAKTMASLAWQTAVGRSGTADPSLEAAARQKPSGPTWFGFHNDASILARLAQQGVAPTPVHLRIAQQMLRYGVPLQPANIEQIRALWQALGGSSLVDLEALTALFAAGLPTDPENFKAMSRLLAGGPAAHLFARTAMTLRSAGPAGPQAEALKQSLQAWWKLGNGPEMLASEMPQFQQLSTRIRQQVTALSGARLPEQLAQDVQALAEHFRAHEMLQRTPQNSLYIPFFQWRDQQPLPGEILIHADRDGHAERTGQYAQVTLAIDTRNLGRITIDLTASRGHLGIAFEVQDARIKAYMDARTPELGKRIAPRTGYVLAGMRVDAVGNGRSISILLPRRRDLRRLSRAVGVL
ncbi:MAG: hypothetical protein VKO64_10575 [Candidatus Sericytochromatia bacterium]|nr:hypothetical protein [Candidatus Sericytochromatia bacterium]